ncbi:MAG TPA: hypothetical protein ENI23_01125 [bacterium]|nr:hypothetical protein [bacterium]
MNSIERKSYKGSPKFLNPKKMKEVAEKILSFLEANFKDGFNERSFYGETFTAATLEILKKDKEFKKELLASFRKKEIDNPSHHQEFNLYALQYMVPDINLKFEKSFLRKVSNWILLRSLVRIRSRKQFEKFKGIIQAKIILIFNRHHGYFTDNTLRSIYKRKSSVSSQYHIFATMLVGEIYEETNNKFFKKEFLEGLNLSIKEVDDKGEAIRLGRGQKQIFGYAALLYSLALAYKITGEEKYLENFQKVFDYVKSYQLDSGRIPLVLTKQVPSKYIYTYNNLFDYLPFLAFQLTKSYNIISE